MLIGDMRPQVIQPDPMLDPMSLEEQFVLIKVGYRDCHGTTETGNLARI